MKHGSSYKELTQSISQNLKPLRSAQPELMQSFGALGKAALADGLLSPKTKEFIALAIGVATRCDACIGFHASALVKLGATEAEIQEVMGVAVYMGGGPSLMYSAKALAAFKEFEQHSQGS